MTDFNNIDELTMQSIMAAFNRFDTGFKARKDNCDIKLPPLSGRLHKTFILSVDKTSNGNNRKYVVQKLNLTVFDLKAVEHMLKLLEVAQERAQAKGAFNKGGILEGWTKVKYYNVLNGKTEKFLGILAGQKILYESDEKGNRFAAWRIMEFVDGRIYNKLADIGSLMGVEHRRQYQLEAADLFGQAIAKFGILTHYIPRNTRFMNTLPGFHDTQGYVDEMEDLLAGKRVPVRPGKKAVLAKMVDGLLDGSYKKGVYTNRVRRMIEIFRNTKFLANTFKYLPPDLKHIISHGDLKINNVIWATDEVGRPDHVKCFIDLDTIGIYTALDDFGDASRSMINELGESIWEEGKVLDEIVLDKDVLEKLIEGYLKVAVNFLNNLTLEELKTYLYRAVAVYFFQLGTRFLKAFISELCESYDGDNKRHFVYFIKFSDDDLLDKNLRLAEVQYMALVRFLKNFIEDLGFNELNIKLKSLREPIGWSRRNAVIP